MEQILSAFLSVRNKITALILDSNSAFERLARAVEKLRTSKAEQSEVTQLSNDITTLEDSVITVSANLSGAIDSIDATVNTMTVEVEQIKQENINIEGRLTALLEKMLFAGTKEFSYETTGPLAMDLFTVLEMEAIAAGVGLVNQQYTLNVAGAAKFSYKDKNGDLQSLSIENGARLLANNTDGVISNVIVLASTGGDIIVPPIDMTTPVSNMNSAVDDILNAYFD
jgi:hypothetical protein